MMKGSKHDLTNGYNKRVLSTKGVCELIAVQQNVWILKYGFDNYIFSMMKYSNPVESSVVKQHIL